MTKPMYKTLGGLCIPSNEPYWKLTGICKLRHLLIKNSLYKVKENKCILFRYCTMLKNTPQFAGFNNEFFIRCIYWFFYQTYLYGWGSTVTTISILKIICFFSRKIIGTLILRVGHKTARINDAIFGHLL